MTETPGFRPPTQERSRETLDRIVGAAVRLLARDTFDGISVDELVAEAGSSKGAFYARFRDKEALFRYLHALRVDEGKRAWTEFFSDPARRDEDAAGLIRGIVTRLLEIYRSDSDRVRAFALRARSRADPEARRTAAELNEFVLDLVETSLARHSDAIGHPDPGSAARFGMTAVGAVAREFVLFGNERLRHEEWGDDRLADELSSIFAGYLRIEPDPFVGP